MKALIALLFLLLPLGAKAAVPTTPQLVILAWDYPTNELRAELSFKLYTSTNLAVPMTNWLVLTNVAGTNLAAAVRIEPGEHFFTLTASNFWGESDFSNVASVPPLPKSGAITIRRGF